MKNRFVWPSIYFRIERDNMKTNKVLKRILTVLLSTAVFICSTPAMASAMELEAEDTLSADVIIEETVSENSIVEEASSLDDGTILEDTISVNSVSGDVIQPDADESLLDESNEIVTPDGALKPGDAIFVEYDLSSYSGQIGYSTVPSGYTTYSDDVYTSNSAIVERSCLHQTFCRLTNNLLVGTLPLMARGLKTVESHLVTWPVASNMSMTKNVVFIVTLPNIWLIMTLTAVASGTLNTHFSQKT